MAQFEKSTGHSFCAKDANPPVKKTTSNTLLNMAPLL